MTEEMKKRTIIAPTLNIPGTKPNAKCFQLLTSTGIPSLDDIVGGGLAIGTLLLIEENYRCNYSNVMLKYFIAEGVINKHALFVASLDTNPKNIINSLPAVISDEEIEKSSNKANEKMIIAWRYEHQMIKEKKSKLKIGHYFDLSKSMNESLINEINVCIWDQNSKDIIIESKLFSNIKYHNLLKSLNLFIKENSFRVDSLNDGKRKNILRIALHNLGSTFWYSESNNDLNLFFYCLRSLARSAYCVIIITAPSLTTQENILRMRHNCDTCIQLDSFNLKQNLPPALSEYNGFFRVLKIPAINTMETLEPETFDLAFKLRRKKFVIEKMHLPPDFAESSEKEQDDIVTSRLSCAVNKNLIIDF